MDEELHPDAREFIEQFRAGPPMHTLTVEELRQQTRSAGSASGEPEPVGTVETVVVRGGGHGVPVRVYAPMEDDAIRDGALPVFIWAHGGGFILGDLEGEDPASRALANATGCIVASVDYRLAPENPFPAALRDMYSVIEWMNRRADEVGGTSGEIIVGGASAGGNLAAASTHLVRERDGPDITYQVLAYPAVSYDGDFESREKYDGYFVTEEFVEYVDERYLSDPIHGYNPYAYPLQADDFSRLPPATIVTAGFDPMLGESNDYATALRDAGIDVANHHYEDMIHSFIARVGDPEWERAREAISDVGEDVRAALETDCST